MTHRLGLDTGGTYTDAVLIDEHQNVIASAKSLTTHADLIKGLRSAADKVLLAGQHDVSLVSLSTTLATNALVEGRGRPVCLILVGYSESQMRRARLQDALGGDPHGFIAGGHTAGGAEAQPLDIAALTRLVQDVDDCVDAYAVSSLFAVRNPAHELQARDLIRQLTDKPVSLGHSLSSGLDAPRRALTALLNARLIPMIGGLLEAAQQMLSERDIHAALMVVKGDGTLVSASVAHRSPVETILSGPAASVVGARFLCDEPDLVVSDMGGTTTDVAVLHDGQPRLSPDGASVGGWRTMVRAVDVRTFGLGGDSAVVYDREQRDFSIGPDRVMSLSLLLNRHPELMQDLQEQLELPYSTTHSAQFVMPHAVDPGELTGQQRELWERIQHGPLAVQKLFSDQTLERALQRLVQRGVVLRAGFTPTDASHILGIQADWSRAGAALGAQLLSRYAEQNLGRVYADETEFATAIRRSVSRLAALAMIETVHNDNGAATLTHSQRQLLRSLFEPSDTATLAIRAAVRLPIVGLGAPAETYYQQTAEYLSTRHINPEHAAVANALGAVVGVVRQQSNITITPAGGRRVTVHFRDGTQVFESLEAGADAATDRVRGEAHQQAQAAGAEDIQISCERHDNIVKTDGQDVFFESRIVATAVGRPSAVIASA